jgi:thiamine-phosphate pyrophosphorylase
LSHPTGPSARWGLADRRLYLCTPDRTDLERFVESCIEGGVDVLQLREKRLTGAELSDRATLVQRVCADYGVPFVLNDDPALAASIGADGVHVGQDDMDPTDARRVMGADAIVGLSTHAPIELDRAMGDGRRAGGRRSGALPVDYISAGPVSPTPTKPGRPGTGVDYVRVAARRAPWTVWVTGGVDPTTVGPLLAVGARHFVVVRWLTEASDPKANARALRKIIDDTLETDGR